MKNLFEKWKTRIPKYSEAHKDLFTSFSQKFGANPTKQVNLGKHFPTNVTFIWFLSCMNSHVNFVSVFVREHFVANITSTRAHHGFSLSSNIFTAEK